MRAAGFDASQPTAWLPEGLLPYLPLAGQDLLFQRVQQLSAPDSRIAVEAFGNEYFDEKIQERRTKMHELRDAVGATGREVADVSELFFNEPHADVADWLRDHGWEVTSAASAELLARHERDLVSDMPDTGRVFVEGRRLTIP